MRLKFLSVDLLQSYYKNQLPLSRFENCLENLSNALIKTVQINMKSHTMKEGKTSHKKRKIVGNKFSR